MSEQAINFHESTFEPIVDTPVQPDPTPVDTPATPTPEKVEDSTSVETPEDNWETRARYFQSEAYKRENLLKQQEAELSALRQPKPEPVQMPQEPTTDDPLEWQNFNTQMNKYNAKRLESIYSKLEETSKKEQQREQFQAQQQEAALRRQDVLGELTKVTKSPEKSQKILEYFSDTSNLKDPVAYNVMYDALMEYKKGKFPVKPSTLTPPPPTNGGGQLKDTDTPEDAFNKRLLQQNKFKL